MGSEPVPTFGRHHPSAQVAASEPALAPAPDFDDDPDLEDVPERTLLDALRDDLEAEAAETDVVLEVPARPGYAVRYATDVRWEQLVKWRKLAANRSMPGGVHDIRLGALILANKCRGIIRNGEPITVEGEPLTFSSHPTVLWPMLGLDPDAPARPKTADVVSRFYARDFHVAATAGRVLLEAGYGEDLSEAGVDPTTA